MVISAVCTFDCGDLAILAARLHCKNTRTAKEFEFSNQFNTVGGQFGTEGLAVGSLR